MIRRNNDKTVQTKGFALALLQFYLSLELKALGKEVYHYWLASSADMPLNDEERVEARLALNEVLDAVHKKFKVSGINISYEIQDLFDAWKVRRFEC